MAVKFPQFDNELLGGSDTWDNDLAGQILLQDYFEPASATTAYVISANTTGPYAATSGLTNSEATFINETSPQQNYGNDSVGLITFSAGGNRQRGLFRFADLANVPDGTVTNAQFGFYSEFGNFTPTESLEISPLKRNYNQTQVTWEDFSTGNTWQQFGADGPSDKGSILDSQSVAGTNLAVFSGTALDAWVQACIDGTDTFQTLLVKFVNDSAPGNISINFWTHLGAVDGERPFLTFDLVGVGSTTLTPSLFTNTNTFYNSTVSQGSSLQSLVVPLFTNTNTFYNVIISNGGLILQPNLFTNSNTFYSTVVTRGAVTLTTSLFTNTNTFYNAVVTKGVVNLTASLFTNTQVFYSASLLDITDNFRITEAGDSRYTESNDFRILEADSSSSNLGGVGTLSAAIKIDKAGSLSLNGVGSLQVSGITVLFESTIYIKVNGIWKEATPYVKYNNNWVIPIYIGKKLSNNWRRIY